MKHIDFNNLKKKDLLSLPHREPFVISTYEKLLIVPTRLKHESGYTKIAIIGVTGDDGEIAAYPDDICWDFTEVPQLSLGMRTDCYYPSGILRVWSYYCSFEVGLAYSSTDIKLVRKLKGEI